MKIVCCTLLCAIGGGIIGFYGRLPAIGGEILLIIGMLISFSLHE